MQINGLELQESDQKIIGSLFHVVNDLERIGDHAENIADDAKHSLENGCRLSDAAVEELRGMANKTMEVYRQSVEQFKSRKLTESAVEEIRAEEEAIDDLAHKLEQNHVDRLNQRQCTPESGMIFINVRCV